MPKPQSRESVRSYRAEITGIILIALAMLSMAGLYITEAGGFAPGQGVGAVGNMLVMTLSAIAGRGKFILPLIMAVAGWKIMSGGGKGLFSARLTAVGGLYILLLAVLHLQLDPARQTFRTGWEGSGGGIFGAAIISFFRLFFGTVGSYIILFALALMALLTLTNLSLVNLAEIGGTWSKRLYRRSSVALTDFIFAVADEEEEQPKRTRKRARIYPPPVIISHEDRDLEAINRDEARGEEIFRPTETPDEPVTGKPHLRLVVPEELDLQESSALELSSHGKVTVGGETRENNEAVPAASGPVAGFQLPPISLIQKSLKVKNIRLNKDITESVKILEETLESFGVKARVTQVSRGPTITRYEMQPAPGVKVSRIVSLADDIALSLAASDVRIEAPIPGKAAIGIEVPNKEVAIVHFREVLDAPEFQESASPLTVALGKDITGNPVVADLLKMPHLLIAGATGSGKSVCMNALIASVLFKARPNEVKFLMIDPKMVELTTFNGIPHLLAPVVTDAKKSATVLRWIVHEMENRYEMFAEAGVRDVVRFNSLKERENPTNQAPFLPYIVVLIDELADLMMVAPADVEDAICRLAQMARAAGIHLVVATQRPSVDVITGLIKANIPSRIAFAVSSQIDSRTILDMSGAEKLLGRGDMLFFPVGASKPVRLQGVYVSDREIEDVVSYLRHQGRPDYILQITQHEAKASPGLVEEDELFPQAVRILIESGQASISMLQRRLRIGYTRAARLIDLMEERGIVGGYEGSKPREVLITMAEFEELYGSE